MTRTDIDSRISRLVALAEPLRRALYRFVARQPNPVSRDEAAEGIGVPRHIAKFHLDRLEEEGLLEAEFKRPPGRSGPGAGRPAKLYRRAAGEVTVSIPDRSYELAGRLMAEAITGAARDGVPVESSLAAAAADLGGAIGDEVRERLESASPRPDAIGAISAVLDEHGYEPRLQEQRLVLANCPFHALARDYTDLVCNMNLDIIDGLLGRLPSGDLVACLEPAPDRCCVVIRERSSNEDPQKNRDDRRQSLTT